MTKTATTAVAKNPSVDADGPTENGQELLSQAMERFAGQRGELRSLGGSQSDEFNATILMQTIQSLWPRSSGDSLQATQDLATLAALEGVAPRDELEGMLAAQMCATHFATMECFRRAMIPGQTFEGRQASLTQANKLTRSFAMLLDSLNRHRGKGQQKMTVEHVHVHSGGQAVVGVVDGGRAAATQGRIHGK